MSDIETTLTLLAHLVEDKWGGWQVPNVGSLCPDGTMGGPGGEGCGYIMFSGAYELRKLTVSFQRDQAALAAQDVDQITFHFLNLTSGSPDASWTGTDYTTVETAWDTFWTGAKVYFPTMMRMTLLSWRADGPAFRPHGETLAPTLRNTSRNVAGTGSGEQLPPQVAVSVTEVTPAKFQVDDVEGVGTQLRNRWGRFYLPAPVVGNISAGRFTTAMTGTLSNLVKTFYNACVSAEIVPVMYSPTTGNAWAVTEVHVDDIADVVRSRRYVTPQYRQINTINQI